MGAPLRAAAPDPLGRRAAPLLRRRPRARAADAASTSPTGLAAAEAAALAQRADGEHARAGRAIARRRMRDELADGARPLRRAARAGDHRPAARRGDRRHAARATWSCPTCASSASAGSAARPRSRRSTSPPPCCAAGCSGSPAAGASGSGPLAVLACLPGEQHDLGLIAFGLALRARGWRIVYLGADTPDRHRRGRLRPAAAEPRRPARGHRRTRPARRRVPTCASEPPPSRARRRRRRERRPGARPRALAHRRPDRRGHAAHDTRPGRTVRTTALGDRICGPGSRRLLGD